MKWARALTDQAAFKTEQRRLGQLWTFLGLAEHLQRIAWFEAAYADALAGSAIENPAE